MCLFSDEKTEAQRDQVKYMVEMEQEFRSLDSLPSALSRAQPCQCSARWRSKMLRDLTERDVRVFKNIYCFVRNDCKYYISKMISVTEKLQEKGEFSHTFHPDSPIFKSLTYLFSTFPLNSRV